jgi:hypothetical protein
MESLSQESRALYDLLKTESAEVYESKFIAYKKEILDAVWASLDDTNNQIKDLSDTVATAQYQMGADLEAAHHRFGSELAAVKGSLSAEIAALSSNVDRAIRSFPSTSAGRTPTPTSWRSGDGAVGQGHGDDPLHRGKASASHQPPPVGGMHSGQISSLCTIPSTGLLHSDAAASAPRVELPQFDGANSKLWQRRCEEYFHRWGTPETMWISYSSSLFTGAAATWLEAFLNKCPDAGWSEFVQAVHARFQRNQHQLLLRRLFHVSQTSSVEEYVQKFSDLVDQISAYEVQPNTLHYITRFLDGLQPAVRVLVAIQQPVDLDTAYTLALLYEELADGITPASSHFGTHGHSSRRPQAHPLPPPPPVPPAKWITKPVEEKRVSDSGRTGAEDKWASLKAYRRSKGLCFVCGEKWGRDHQCKAAIQLHVVREMIDYMRLAEDDSQSENSEGQSSEQLMMLSAAAASSGSAGKSMKIMVEIQGHSFSFLIDSGSSSCFIDQHAAQLLSGKKQLSNTVQVQVAGGKILRCDEGFSELQWSSQGYQFCDSFRILNLQNYDGILGLDWLAKYSPMLSHWAQQWIAFQAADQLVVLHGEDTPGQTYAMLELHIVREAPDEAVPKLRPDLQSLLDQFASVFDAPTGLPPRRQYDHQIPLIPGARPVSMRPYRVAPELKSEIEQQIQELLRLGVITHSNSPFASPVLLVRKQDKTWRLVVDYRHLNALTVKGKYPLPVIDELLDELAGARWFSKLDLRAGYHQIRLAPGEEFKTAFQTHNGHYEFKVMAFGLTGAPATFQFAMNASLAPVLRKFALVFFDDILIYSVTYEDHLKHVEQVLSILRKDQWQVKLSKCAFAQEKISYLGHVISACGVATDDSKIESIRTWPVPTNLKELRGFLGITGYYRKFIRHYAIISQPLTALLKKGSLYVWTDSTETAFQTLKSALMTAPVLALPDYKLQFVVETDACDIGIGAVLSQNGHPLAYVSKSLGPRNRTLSVYEKEYLAILLAVEQWRSYLQMGEFVIRTDHKSLTHLDDQRLHTDWQQKALTKLMGLQGRVQEGQPEWCCRCPVAQASAFFRSLCRYDSPADLA